jgi:hypothetical protein
MLFSRFETLLIALALIVPESLRSWAKSLEPYPAVILPAGASTIRIKRGTVPMSRLFLTAKRNGKWEEVDVAKFMAPISKHYFGHVAGRGFGFPKSRRASPRQLEQAAQTKRWMKAKLTAQGFETKELRVMSEKLTVALPSGKQTGSRVSRKKTYDLD